MTPGARTQGYHMPHLQLIRYTIWYNISYQGRGVEAGYPQVREDIQGLIKSALGRWRLIEPLWYNSGEGITAANVVRLLSPAYLEYQGYWSLLAIHDNETTVLFESSLCLPKLYVPCLHHSQFHISYISHILHISQRKRQVKVKIISPAAPMSQAWSGIGISLAHVLVIIEIKTKKKTREQTTW